MGMSLAKQHFWRIERRSSLFCSFSSPRPLFFTSHIPPSMTVKIQHPDIVLDFFIPITTSPSPC